MATAKIPTTAGGEAVQTNAEGEEWQARLEEGQTQHRHGATAKHAGFDGQRLGGWLRHGRLWTFAWTPVHLQSHNRVRPAAAKTASERRRDGGGDGEECPSAGGLADERTAAHPAL